MKAVAMSKHGDINVLEYTEDFPKPQPGKGEVLVKVSATSTNNIDFFVCQGYPGLELEMPHIPGGDIVGSVEDTGEGVKDISLGTRVVVYPLVACKKCQLCKEGKGNLCINWKFFGLQLNGGYGEYAVVPAENIIKLPDTMPFEKAATISVAGLTAYHGIKNIGNLKEKETFFIWGGAGGLGTFAIQIAKNLGAKVIATASTKDKMKLMRELGADLVLNRKTDDVEKEVMKYAPAGVDLAFDYVGPETFGKSFNILKKGGNMILCGMMTGRETQLSIHMTYLKHLNLHGIYLGTRQDMEELLKLVEDGNVKPYIGKTFNLEKAKDALKHMQSENHVGKIVLKV